MTKLEPQFTIFVAGASGMVGSALVRRLKQGGYSQILTPTRQELDLTNQYQVQTFFENHQPDIVFLAAAKVGGIHANVTYPADFIRDNLLIQTHVMSASYHTKVKKLVFLGSSCIYPRDAPQPLLEEYLLTGPLEPTNQAYAVAKIAGIQMIDAYRQQYECDWLSVMPTNLYGPGDNFDLKTSHVVPALIRKFHEAKLSGAREVDLWGSGQPRREFLFVDDLADAVIFLAEQNIPENLINVGIGEDITIKELAELIADVVGVYCDIKTNPSQPDGTPRKLMNVSKLNSLGWHPKTALRHGLEITYDWYVRYYHAQPPTNTRLAVC